MNSAIEEKLRLYRARREEERQKELLSSRPLLERLLPQCLIPATSVAQAPPKAADVDPPLEGRLDEAESVAEEADADVWRGSRRRRRPPPQPPAEPDVPVEPVEASSRIPEPAALAYGLPLLKLLLWTVLMALAVEIEFGFVFVALTLFYVVLTNLRDGRRAAGEPSAYSVFNADCRPLDGELRAEMFERTLRGGGL